MIIVRFEIAYARCCMTAEVAAFSNYGEYKEERLQALIGERGSRHLNGGHDFYHSNDTIYGKGATDEEAWKNAIEGLRENVQHYSYNGTQVRYFWFVDYDGDGWQHEELRTIIKDMPGVVALGEYINANTSNRLIGYMVPFENENGSEGDDD